MKTSKLYRALMLTVLLFGVSFMISSCTEDETSSSSAIVGTWIDSNDSKDVLTIGSNGSWYSVYDKGGKLEQIRKGSYSYDASTRTIMVSIQAVPNKNNAYTMTIFVQSLSENRMSLVSDSFGSKIYKKQ